MRVKAWVGEGFFFRTQLTEKKVAWFKSPLLDRSSQGSRK